MKEQSQVEEMRAAIRGDRERAFARIRSDGRQPVFMREAVAQVPASEPPAEEQLIDAQARSAATSRRLCPRRARRRLSALALEARLPK
jgi:hypothetical protein